uniref:Exostosin GT47 domain-containing protein n=1 Tax=Chromera velia CCMP2878 TaxID=1169474 RepID=A0A0G4I454_9ALVE|eukprot:Cvel_1787.t1-p1 / transcript=Cvel_1787.t1 / gene=Cvel_1787 / organism=Chromera_velia_CCMP2878 / gene_product=hypothetical protein / transcript_product=hypothetical protein / location=Cvel_scaffold65:136293-139054(+) / protein_length=642 / sequence_SO=supercontig / SO=protein_coding / is_pseudo=false
MFFDKKFPTMIRKKAAMGRVGDPSEALETSLRLKKKSHQTSWRSCFFYVVAPLSLFWIYVIFFLFTSRHRDATEGGARRRHPARRSYNEMEVDNKKGRGKNEMTDSLSREYYMEVDPQPMQEILNERQTKAHLIAYAGFDPQRIRSQSVPLRFEDRYCKCLDTPQETQFTDFEGQPGRTADFLLTAATFGANEIKGNVEKQSRSLERALQALSDNADALPRLTTGKAAKHSLSPVVSEIISLLDLPQAKGPSYRILEAKDKEREEGGEMGAQPFITLQPLQGNGPELRIFASAPASLDIAFDPSADIVVGAFHGPLTASKPEPLSNSPSLLQTEVSSGGVEPQIGEGDALPPSASVREAPEVTPENERQRERRRQEDLGDWETDINRRSIFTLLPFEEEEGESADHTATSKEEMSSSRLLVESLAASFSKGPHAATRGGFKREIRVVRVDKKKEGKPFSEGTLEDSPVSSSPSSSIGGRETLSVSEREFADLRTQSAYCVCAEDSLSLRRTRGRKLAECVSAAVSALCIPVVVADWAWLPQGCIWDWTQMGVFVPERLAGRAGQLLRELPREATEARQRALQKAQPWFDPKFFPLASSSSSSKGGEEGALSGVNGPQSLALFEFYMRTGGCKTQRKQTREKP